MLFGKKRKAKQRLDELWRAMEMSCENNYKDMAQDGLREFEEQLEQYHREQMMPEEDYRRRKQLLEEKKRELTGYDHKQHIGW